MRKLNHSDSMCAVSQITQDTDNSCLILGKDGQLTDTDPICGSCVKLIYDILGLPYGENIENDLED